MSERRPVAGFFTGKGAALAVVLPAMVIGMVLAVPGTARAHAALVKSVPAQRAVVQRPPGSIQLWFSERLETRFSTFSLIDAQGRRVETGPMVQVGDDPRSLAAEVKALPPGRYRVRCRVLSTDGHVTEKEFSFSVAQ